MRNKIQPLDFRPEKGSFFDETSETDEEIDRTMIELTAEGVEVIAHPFEVVVTLPHTKRKKERKRKTPEQEEEENILLFLLNL